MKREFKINIIKNKSTTYMLPFIHEQVQFKFIDQILNSYLSCENGDDIFCVMYEWSSLPDFLKYEGEMMNNHLYLGHEDYGDKVVYKFRLSRHMQMGKELFIQGKYKEFSNDHKKSIVQYLRGLGATNLHRIIQILDKNAELESTPPIMENEVLSNHVKELKVIIEDFADESS